MEERFKIYAAAYAILLRDGKVLLMRRCNTGWQDGFWGLPAGHIEEDETPLKAAIREAKEEAGVDIKSEDLKLAHVVYRKARQTDGSYRFYADYYFAAEKWGGEPQITEPDKCDELGWFALPDLPEDITDIKQALENYSNGVMYSEYGWDEAS